MRHWGREMRGAAFEHQGLVQVPVTLAWAQHDRVLSRPGPERVPGGTRQLMLAGCGQIPTWDGPGQVALPAPRGFAPEAAPPGTRLAGPPQVLRRQGDGLPAPPLRERGMGAPRPAAPGDGAGALLPPPPPLTPVGLLP